MSDSRPTPSGIEAIETASIDELRSLQLERLQWSLRHAYDNVPHYQRTFAASGIHPGDLRSLENLARFPFTTKADLRDNYPFGLFAVPRERVARIHASSGTTGKPTVVGYTRDDIDVWATLVARSIRAAGGRLPQGFTESFAARLLGAGFVEAGGNPGVVSPAVVELFELVEVPAPLDYGLACREHADETERIHAGER